MLRAWGATTFAGMRVYALVEIGERLAVDVLVRREDAFAMLEEERADESSAFGNLYVVPIELDERNLSAN